MPVRRCVRLAHANRRTERTEHVADPSMGPIRKADPTSGATFNVEVVRGKMSGKCLLHACRALSIGVSIFLFVSKWSLSCLIYYKLKKFVGASKYTRFIVRER